MDEDSLRKLANQLSQPQGREGVAIGEKMSALNATITQNAIKHLAPKAGERIIEIGPGNGVLSCPIINAIGPNGHYLGIDHSPEMTQFARESLQQKNLSNAHFVCCDVNDAKVERCSIDGLLAVNVLYFIDDLASFFAHIKPWLKPGGRAVFAVRSPEVLKAIPVTQYGFNIRTIEAISQTLCNAGFSNITSIQYDEGISSLDDLQLMIDSVIITGELAQ